MITAELEDQEVLSGSKVRLDCTSEGTPDPVVVWTHGDTTPVYQGSLVTMATNGSLLFSSADRSHDGLYTCWAISSSGVAKKQARLRVTAKKGWKLVLLQGCMNLSVWYQGSHSMEHAGAVDDCVMGCALIEDQCGD